MKEKISVVDAVNKMHQRTYQAGINMLKGVTKSSIEGKKKFSRMTKINGFFDSILGKVHKKES